MGLFGFGKEKKKSDIKNNQDSNSASLDKSFSKAISLLQKSDYESQLVGRQMMVELADIHGNCDPKVSIWMAQDYEKNGCLSAAAEWYEIALKQGVSEAEIGYKRCYNPYNIDPYYSINGTRGCGTPHFDYVQRMEEKAKRDYENVIDKFNNNPSEADADIILRTIYQIASANKCCVPEAQQWMGFFFETARKDNIEAANWFKKAADNGSIDSAFFYADMLINGRGVEKDEEEAIKYYHIAADKGQVESMFFLGQYYFENGDSEKAKFYFKNAADHGFSPALETLEKIDRGEDIYEDPDYQEALEYTFSKIANENELSVDGLVEYFADIFEPDDFCQKAFDFCNKQYAGENRDKMTFEYNMTAFYGSICAVALWNKNNDDFSGTTVWKVIEKSIDPEFTDGHAEELLGTKDGEVKAESIYALIQEYMSISIAIMNLCHCDRDACINAMKLAYKLGMLVAKKELSVQNKNLIREFIVSNKNNSDNNETLKNTADFYTECVKEFHDIAMTLGVANRGVIFIPELIKYGEKTILNLLKDPFYQSEFSQDPNSYYAFIMALSIDAGIVFGTKWHEDFSDLSNYVDKIMKKGPSEDAEKLMKKYLPHKLFRNQGNPFFSKIYPHWVSLHEPYWKLEDPRDYTFKLMIAAYQLGISLILEKFGF